jgi:phage recombination protein Bet
MNDLQKIDNFSNMWQKKEIVEQIRKCFAPTLNEIEFNTLVEIGRSTGLNPFKREIWAIKYGNKEASIFIGRDGYRASIGRNSNYGSHIVDAVYENDTFNVDLVNSVVEHKYDLKNRGRVVGAYCLVFMKSTSRPYYVFAQFDEYNLKQSLWLSKPATMIKKVAEAQCIRMALPNVYGGTYLEDEMGHSQISHSNESLNSNAIHNRLIENEVTTLGSQQKTDEMIEEIKTCQSYVLLRQIGLKIREVDLTLTDKKKLADAYRQRILELKNESEETEKEEETHAETQE